MADPIYSAAVWNPGAAAGYRFGRNRVQLVICHFTVGVNSTPIGLRGYFNFLVSRDGTVQQFAEVDALTWHAGIWNGYGPGIEVEYYAPQDASIFTDASRAACGALVRWLNSEWGVPLTYYDGPRQSTSDQTGFMSHRSLVQSEQHYDWWPQEDWDTMVAPLPSPPTKRIHMFDYWLDPATGKHYYHTGTALIEETDPARVTQWITWGSKAYTFYTAEIEAEQARLALLLATGGGGVTVAQLRAELDRTKLSH